MCFDFRINKVLYKVVTPDTEHSKMSNTNEQASPNINQTSVKLPEFWTKSPAVWFARIEAQFNTKNISQDQTKYDYVVSALDANTAEEIQHILLNPPTTGKYESLKNELNKTFGKSQFERDSELLNINGLGDRRPSALLRKINALNNDPQTLKRAIFLANLPSEIRNVLVAQHFTDTEQLAAAADRVWESQSYNINHIRCPPMSPASPIMHNEEIDSVDAISANHKSRRPRQQSKRSTSPPSICFYHTRFGLDARKCQGNCKFSSLPSSKVVPKFSGNA